MPDNNMNQTSNEENTAAPAWPDFFDNQDSNMTDTPETAPDQTPSDIPTTPIAPPDGTPAYPGDDISGIPTTPVAPPGGTPAYPGPTYGNSTFPDFPIFSFPSQNYPSAAYYGQVRFLNASTGDYTLDVLIDGQNVFSGSDFATVSSYISVSDGFHSITVRRTRGTILYQQTLAFVSGERVTMVILDNAVGVTLTKVSDMGCTNVPSGYGCLRVANMTYNGSSYDVRLFNDQVLFASVGFKEVTSFKQASAGNYTFFVTSAQSSITSFNELPVLIFGSIIRGNCVGCAINNPLLTYNVNVRAGGAYTSYIIGNPWSNMYQVLTLED